MKVTLNWLKHYVEITDSVEALTERLTMIGMEVEGVEILRPDFEGVVVAEVLKREQHPNADRLSVCQVNDGTEVRQIVCGATNFKVGDKVPLILPGASLPGEPGEKPFVIKVGKLRGVESQGMMCSPKELHVTQDGEGLMILDAHAEPGMPFAKYLGRPSEADVVFDLEITPNRPDLNSVIGIAREISAATGKPLKLPDVQLPASRSLTAGALVKVRLEDEEWCPRYTARVVQGLQVGPSPEWLSTSLEKVGVRSINNVVDVTNYVMLEVGQPLHAFDFHLLHPGTEGLPTIVVRRAKDGEVFQTLDEQKHQLNLDNLLIADEDKAIALAGVMGGLNTEIRDDTRDVLIESACFHPSNIRKTSKQLGLSTESSYRFERGADIAATEWASRRAAQLILETAGGTLAEGVVDSQPTPEPPKSVSLRFSRCDQLLGVSISPEEQTAYLTRLGINPIGEPQSDSATFSIPSFRLDLKREVDLIEEICRMHGIDRIPSTVPKACLGSNAFDETQDRLEYCRSVFVGMGFHETQGQTLINSDQARRLHTTPIPLEHPLSSDMDVLRPSLLPGLLDSMRNNVAHDRQRLRLFEIGRIFLPSESTVQEVRSLGVVMTGDRELDFWGLGKEPALVDLYDLKGVLEAFLDRLGMRGVRFERREAPTELFVESAQLVSGKQAIGQMGQLLPQLGRAFDFKHPVFLLELDLDLLFSRRSASPSFQSLPTYPASRRDVAMVIDESITHADILDLVKKAKPQNLESARLFDVFRGHNIPAGKKSVAYAFTYRSADKTLKENDVNQAHDALVQRFQKDLSADIR